VDDAIEDGVGDGGLPEHRTMPQLLIGWHDGQGMCLYAKRLERGRFIWPSPADGTVTITPGQLGYLLDHP
jgi:transposase